jgi:cytochrome c
MRRLPLLALIFAAALAACSQPSSTPSQTATAPLPPPSPPIVTPEIAAKLAALPAPFNTADYLNGRRIFAQCKSCHTIEKDGGNRVGPNLHGIFGRKAGTAPDFAYSPAVKNSGITWDEHQLDAWLTNPQTFLPGNRMTFPGIRNEESRRDAIAYLSIEAAK